MKRRWEVIAKGALYTKPRIILHESTRRFWTRFFAEDYAKRMNEHPQCQAMVPTLNGLEPLLIWEVRRVDEGQVSKT